MIHDNFTLNANNINHVGRVWLMASYLYYLRPDLDSFLTDSEFDHLTQILMDNYEELTIPQKFPNGGENPPLSNLISMGDLQAGTGYSLREHDYPTITKSAAVQMCEDKFWKLKEEFLFRFPHVKRVRKRIELCQSKVADSFNRDKVYNSICAREPALQDPDRYYQGNRDSEFYDEDRERRAVVLKDNEAEEFLNGMLSEINKTMGDGLVLGNIFYRDGTGWVASIYDPTRTLNIERS